MKLLSFIILTFFAITTFGQSNTISTSKYTLKLYNTSFSDKWIGYSTILNSNGDTLIAPKQYQELAYLHPSIALNWKGKNRISHEVELSRFSWLKTSVQYIYPILPLYQNLKNRLDIALRYEYIYRIGKENARFSPSISAGINPYFRNMDLIPFSSIIYPIRYYAIGAKVNIIPRLNIKVKNRWLIDINTPISLTDQNIQRNIRKNPSLPFSEQISTYFHFSALSDMSLRIGIGYKL